jgi:branched-chain amino acid transport system substrate-binding protein
VACREEGIRIVAEAPIAQTAQDIGEAVRRLHDAKASAIVHCGFGFGIVYINPALEALGWDPPRFTGTAWQNAWLNPVMWNAFLGWTGLDQYDEATRSASGSSTSTRPHTGGARSTACLW